MLERFRVKALLCDLDGTLVDSIPCLYAIFKKVLAKAGVEATKKEFNELVGLTTKEITVYLEKTYGLPRGFVKQTYLEDFEKEYLSKVTWHPGALETLRSCESCGIKIALVTSMQKDLVLRFLSSRQAEQYFEVVVGGGDTLEAKPSAQPFEEAIKQLGVDFDLALGIEDSHPGLLSGKRAGIKMLQFHPNEKMNQLADGGFTSWKEFPSWILA
jgi:HAD superfamily hydrolase (TIGR01509 family)